MHVGLVFVALVQPGYEDGAVLAALQHVLPEELDQTS